MNMFALLRDKVKKFWEQEQPAAVVVPGFIAPVTRLSAKTQRSRRRNELSITSRRSQRSML